jgi:hypothetical protein
LARQNGLIETELVETLTHLAFYAGWPSAMSTADIACGVFATPAGGDPLPDEWAFHATRHPEYRRFHAHRGLRRLPDPRPRGLRALRGGGDRGRLPAHRHRSVSPAVGRGLRTCGVPHNELFVTAKPWVQDAGSQRTHAAIDRSLRKLLFDCLDLYPIHQLFGDVHGS